MAEYDEDATQIVQIPVGEQVAKRKKRDRCTLVILSGPTPGRVITADGDELIIGRGNKVNARIDDTGLSRRHARLYRQGDLWYVEDMGSTNGTWIAGAPVNSPTVVQDGDRVLVGQSTLLRVTLQDEVEQETARQAYEATVRDALTQVYNRRHLDEQMRLEFAFAQRHATDLSVLLLDADHFKNVNDTHGHLAGDQVLRSLAVAISRAVRAEDMVARYGGEEFAVVARGTNGANAMILGERIRARVQKMAIEHEGNSLQITVSIGVASMSKTDTYNDVSSFFAAADAALYRAKEEGRNRVCHASA
ncbi:MAG: GGDEF domain-containing protein [Myxococcales bacterium]|nr:GGDEF domain-containing protein [Myxococcales bacterium]